MRLVVEADGGSWGNPGPAAYGALVRDAETGAVLAETAEVIGSTTNNVAEYRGLLAGLTLAVELDPDAEVEVRMDSKLVVEQMAGRWKIKHPDLRPLAQQASLVFPDGVAGWTWVPRERNRRADTLVNAALDGRLDQVMAQPAQPAQPAQVEPVASRPPAAPVLSRSDAAATVLFLRHGRTADNVSRRFAGPRTGDGVVEVGLDEVGRHQAAVVAAALSDADVAGIVSSPRRRARETADVVAGALGLGVTIDPAFADFDPGGWDGRTSDEVRVSHPAWHAAWSVSPDVAPPDGESVRAVQARVLASIGALLSRYGGRRVLVVSHAVPIGTALTAALEAPLTTALRLHIANGSLSVVRYPVDGPPRIETVSAPAGTVLPN
jgi:broad specificity phosphatase PhoE/ribonuclease HI